MMAARAMDSCDAQEYACSRGIVSACESYLPMVKLMRKVLRLNSMERKVQVFPKRSDELKAGVDLASHADILVRALYLYFSSLNYYECNSVLYLDTTPANFGH